jgi:PilZ domain-containing protein
MATPGDRRKRPRVALHWPVRLFRQPEGQSIESTTENLSSQGLYCIASEPFKPGERLQCEIFIPGESLGFSESSIRLQCQITVTRLELLDSGFGLGCHVEDYTLATGLPPPPM